MTWNATLYRRFENERTRPALDLLARVVADAPRLVVDLGCGPGNSTELLVRRWPDAEVIGIDSAPSMIEAARERLPGARFELADLTTWTPPGPCDVVFSNATLQWVPDHAALYPRLASWLAPGGWLAVQVPDNFAEPTHALMRDVAIEMGREDVVTAAEAERSPIASFEDHYRWLHPRPVDLWRTTYVHPLAGADAIVEWLRATGLRPYLARLEGSDFLTRYRDAIARTFPTMPDGKVLLRFPRLFVTCRATDGD